MKIKSSRVRTTFVDPLLPPPKLNPTRPLFLDRTKGTKQNKKEKKNNQTISLKSHKNEPDEISFFDILMYILERNEDVNSKSSQCSEEK